eukprot:COSAG01_NODE_166_length_23296_cov_140.506014_11_plen_50_part_00
MMFAAFMMDRKWRGKYLQSLSAYFSAFNHVYRSKKLGSPENYCSLGGYS